MCGTGIWFGPGHPINTADDQSPWRPNPIKIAAVVVTLRSVSPLTPLEIISDSRYIINGLTKHLASWEDAVWIGIQRT